MYLEDAPEVVEEIIKEAVIMDLFSDSVLLRHTSKSLESHNIDI